MSTTTEFKITVIQTNEHGNTNEVTMGFVDYLTKLHNAAEPKVHKATQDFHAKTGFTVYAHAGKKGFTIFIPDPVPGEYIVVELAQVDGTPETIHVRTESTKNTKIGGSENYVIKEIGKGIRLASNGGDYIIF